MASELLDHAQTYGESGWSIFPVCSPATRGCSDHGVDCENPGKIPLIRWASAQERIADPDLISTWWRRWPHANIGLATGRTSGVSVIDLDGRDAVAEAKRRGISRGPYTATGRIGGHHLYCAWRPDAPTVFARASGIDFRGEGGYVVLPPSRHKTGAVYSWVIGPDQAELPPLPEWVDQMATTDRDGQERGPIVISKLFADGIPDGERDITLFRVAAKLRAVDVPEDVALGVLLELGARCRPPFEPDLTRRKIESAYKRYQPTPTLAHDSQSAQPLNLREQLTVVLPD